MVAKTEATQVNQQQVREKSRSRECVHKAAKPKLFHWAALYPLNCTERGAIVSESISWVGMPILRASSATTRLNTIVAIVTPKEVPIYWRFIIRHEPDKIGMDGTFTWVIVWNKAPPTLCSWGSAILATNIVPEAYTKSAPMTHTIAEGNPKAQYGDGGLMSAKSRLAAPVHNVPKTNH